jgi:hypothetical protein
VQHLPHWFHAATAFGTLALELVLVLLFFLPRPFRILCFFIVTPWQVGVILTANYTFLNYLVLALGIFLLDDRFLAPFVARFVPESWREKLHLALQTAAPPPAELPLPNWQRTWARYLASVKLSLTAIVLLWLFYSSTVLLLLMFWRDAPLPYAPVAALQPFRIADRYGLFAVMTRGRYEIEFQGSNDGENWIAYPFRFKPQDPAEPPRIYAPYQPRFDWNLWFASLGHWRSNPIVPRTEERLLEGSPDVLALFASNPFPQPPRQVRVLFWQYWFTSMPEKRGQGFWWRRQLLGNYAPTLGRDATGRIIALEWPPELPPRQ